MRDFIVAQDMLRLGGSLQQAADAVGYGSSSALSRAFSHYCGQSLREWRAVTALQWLFTRSADGTRSKEAIDDELAEERSW